MTRKAFVNAYTASCMKSLAANDPGSPAEMACCEVQYRESAARLWRRSLPGIRSITKSALEEILTPPPGVVLVRGKTADDAPWPWCEVCRSYHHPANPTCFLLTRPAEVSHG